MTLKNIPDQTSKPLVSIILPVFNAGAHLRPCMDTLLNQTLHEIEIICILDCPTDGSDKIIEEYATKDNRVIVIRNEQNLSIGESRNVGLRAARGEYIGFSDHDDTHELNMYENLYSATENGKKNIVFSGILVDSILNHELPTYLYDLSETINSLPLYQQIFYSLIPREGRKYRMHITPNLYRRRFIVDHYLSFVDTKICFAEDKLFLLSALSSIQHDEEIALLSQKLYLYRLHENNAHLSNWYYDREHVFSHLNYISDIAEKNTWIDNRICMRILSVLQVSLLYSTFRHDSRQAGLFSTLKTYRSQLRSAKALKQSIKDIPIRTKGMTIPKRIFLLWLKKTCRS